MQRLDGMLRADDVVLLLTSGELGGLIKTIPRLVESEVSGAHSLTTPPDAKPLATFARVWYR